MIVCENFHEEIISLRVSNNLLNQGQRQGLRKVSKIDSHFNYE